MISFAGNITFPKAQPIRDAAKEVPLDRCSSKPTRPFSRRFRTAANAMNLLFVKEVARQMGELRGLSTEEVGRQTASNFYRFFNLL